MNLSITSYAKSQYTQNTDNYRTDTEDKLNDDEEKNKINKKKKKYHLTKEIKGKYLYTYSVSDDGQKTLLKKIPAPNLNKSRNNKYNLNGLFENDNPKFNDPAVIATTKASLKYRQEIFHKKNIKEIIELLNPIKSM